MTVPSSMISISKNPRVIRSLLFLAFLAFGSLAFGQSDPKNRMIAFTFDDLPMTGAAMELKEASDVTRKLIAKLKTDEVPAIGFVNESKLIVPGEIDRRTSLLEMWLQAGFELGNHTYSHVSIDNATLDEYLEEVIRGETISKAISNKYKKPYRFFRHTQLRTGPTEEFRRNLDLLLKMRGYTIAPVTIDSNEYIYAVRYVEAIQKRDPALKQKIIDSYLTYMESVTAHFERISSGFLGYEPRQILLLHANRLNADCLEQLIAMYKSRGYGFVSLTEALADPAYRLPEVTSSRGLSWIHRWMLAAGKEISPEPDVPDWVNTRIQ